MQNPILALFLHFDVTKYPNPRWQPDAILKNYLFTNSQKNDFLCVFWFAGSNFDGILAILCPSMIKATITAFCCNFKARVGAAFEKKKVLIPIHE